MKKDKFACNCKSTTYGMIEDAVKNGDKSYEEVEKRITNITTRGIVLRSGNTLRDAYNERVPLYEKYSDITIDCSSRDIESSMRELVAKL